MPNREISSGRNKPTIQQKVSSSIQNNFTGGLKTEFTGLNFPENACTSVDNCVFSIIGDVLRREGINFEPNAVLNSINATGSAISYFRWLNAGGDGDTEVLVVQVGATLYFYETSLATEAAPVSAQLVLTNIAITPFQAAGNTDTIANIECQFAAGNGYLFVYHPSCDPFYCTFDPSTQLITSAVINLMVRDFTGFFPEPGNPSVTFRSTTLTPEHNYNLLNQGWTGAPTWTAFSTDNLIQSPAGLPIGLNTFNVATGISGIAPAQNVTLNWIVKEEYFNSQAQQFGVTNPTGSSTGVVVSYTGGVLILSITTTTTIGSGPQNEFIRSLGNSFTITSGSISNTINTWFSDLGDYPANSDIWWLYKDDGTNSGDNGVPTFNPSDTVGEVMQPNAQAPQGHFVLNVFNQNQSGISGVSGITNIMTTIRPQTGTFFQGRVWFSGINASQIANGDQNFYTWSENIYFSQIITSVNDFGNCYQQNDPTDENFFDLLPSDGGVITIPGCGNIYKLFPMQNGLLVFAANGIWFIRGNAGLGFTADDYSINKISAVQSITGTSVVDVNGLPMFWNEEGIYAVEPSQGQSPYGFGGLSVNPITVGTILSFYNDIPLDSKRFARGDYNPLNYTLTWVYRSVDEAGISNRYQFDSALNLNLYNKAFYPYTFADNTECFVSGVVYINYPTGTLDPQFKYLTAVNTEFTLSEENDNVNYLDWFTFDNVGTNYISTFITGYQIKGSALTKFQPMYVYVFSRNDTNTAYEINSIWDFATSGNAGKNSTKQVVFNAVSNFGMVYRRHRLRGRGLAMQIQVSSVTGQPFDIMGWSVLETISGSV